MRNVCLRYASKGPDVLRNVDLDIEPGSFVGVVGRTGGGKSSLASVLLRLALPHSGRVLIDGIDATKIGLHALRRHVGYLPQTPWIFEGSLRENLDLTDSFSDDDIMQALADAGILRGLHRSRRESTYMSEGGAGIAKSVDGFADDDAAFLDQPMSSAFSGFLSTGQMQLLCFARLLLQRPQVFILDEGTMMAFIFVYVSPFCARMMYDSLTMIVCVCVCMCISLLFDNERLRPPFGPIASAHVDAHSETLMLEVVALLVKQGKTVIWIAHKLDTISKVGHVLVLDGGIIVEKGKPSELMRDRNSTLYRLVRPRGVHRFTDTAAEDRFSRASPADAGDTDGVCPNDDAISPRHVYRGYFEAAKASHLFRSLSAPILLQPNPSAAALSPSPPTPPLELREDEERVPDAEAEQTVSTTAGDDDDDDDDDDGDTNGQECSPPLFHIHTCNASIVRRAYSI